MQPELDEVVELRITRDQCEALHGMIAVLDGFVLAGLVDERLLEKMARRLRTTVGDVRSLEPLADYIHRNLDVFGLRLRDALERQPG